MTNISINESKAYYWEGTAKPRANSHDYQTREVSKHLVVEGIWHREFERLATKDVKGVSVVSSTDADIGWIYELLPDVEIALFRCRAIVNADKLSKLSKLEQLTITSWKDQVIKFDLSETLKVFQVTWMSKFELPGLPSSTEYVIIEKAKNIDLNTILGKAKKLQKLSLIDGKADLDIQSLIPLHNLRYVSLFNCKQIKFSEGATVNKSLKFLDLDKMEIDNVNWLSQFPDLDILILRDCGEIDSLSSLGALKSLRGLTVAGSSKVIDGDLSSLEKLKNLRNLVVRDFRHYTHKSLLPWRWDRFESNASEKLYEKKK